MHPKVPPPSFPSRVVEDGVVRLGEESDGV